MADLWARQSIASLLSRAKESEAQAIVAHDGVPLKRTLTAINLVALGIGAIIGAGIFVLTGNAAAENAGPAISISFVLSGIACGFAGLCYAEMASSVPVAGSAYTYAYATLGEIVAWIIGWDLVLEYSLGATTVAIGWSGYVVSLLQDFGVPLTLRYASSPFDYDATTGVWHTTGAILNVPQWRWSPSWRRCSCSASVNRRGSTQCSSRSSSSSSSRSSWSASGPSAPPTG
jgi:APA family basic amino acid/polyamine antiporter